MPTNNPGFEEKWRSIINSSSEKSPDALKILEKFGKQAISSFKLQICGDFLFCYLPGYGSLKKVLGVVGVKEDEFFLEVRQIKSGSESNSIFSGQKIDYYRLGGSESDLISACEDWIEKANFYDFIWRKAYHDRSLIEDSISMQSIPTAWNPEMNYLEFYGWQIGDKIYYTEEESPAIRVIGNNSFVQLELLTGGSVLINPVMATVSIFRARNNKELKGISKKLVVEDSILLRGIVGVELPIIGKVFLYDPSVDVCQNYHYIRPIKKIADLVCSTDGF